jgi:hypothetical protein
VNRKRVQRLMRLMAIAAFGPKLKTTKTGAGTRDNSRSSCATW